MAYYWIKVPSCIDYCNHHTYIKMTLTNYIKENEDDIKAKFLLQCADWEELTYWYCIPDGLSEYNKYDPDIYNIMDLGIDYNKKGYTTYHAVSEMINSDGNYLPIYDINVKLIDPKNKKYRKNIKKQYHYNYNGVKVISYKDNFDDKFYDYRGPYGLSNSGYEFIGNVYTRGL